MKTITINLFIVLALATFCQAQSNQIIIQLNEDISIHQLNSSNKMFQFTQYQQLSKSLNIWLIEIPATQTTQTTLKKESVLNDLKNHPQIKTAQFNQGIEFRNTPNDIWFDDQWQYNNKAEAQGITDADIDAPKAWEITTGGLTAIGDEIVVAIIDGGVDLNHPDLVNNLWFNSHEIPDNKIDDDNNGYVDDYYGWNFNDSITDIGNAGYGHWHGTPVTGIIGAEGNNYEGVCGVNWKVKVMNLIANQTVAGVIAAYDYVLQMRKRYNKTNGQEGTFVVATNASLGINEGKPADHPLWCAMYNALGEAGILSVAATTNQSINVDLRGDLPTTCSSDFLIAVTNTNNRDELEFAGFGKRHIDLSAPGSGVFTTLNNSDYGIFGGTSAATPHVAGAIALLYSIPNEQFIKAAHQNPSTTALLVKDFILNGTDPVLDLYIKSVSGGRLNLFNSICIMENYFNNNSCVEAKESFLQIDEVFLNMQKNEIKIHFELQGESYIKVRLFDITGRLIQSKYLSNINTGKHHFTLSGNSLLSGIYYAFIHSKNTSVSHAVLVQ